MKTRSKAEIIDTLSRLANKANRSLDKFDIKALAEISHQLDGLLPDKLENWITPDQFENRAQLTAIAFKNMTMEACAKKVRDRAAALFAIGNDPVAIAMRTLANEIEADRVPVKAEHDRLLNEVTGRNKKPKPHVTGWTEDCSAEIFEPADGPGDADRWVWVDAQNLNVRVPGSKPYLVRLASGIQVHARDLRPLR